MITIIELKKYAGQQALVWIRESNSCVIGTVEDVRHRTETDLMSIRLHSCISTLEKGTHGVWKPYHNVYRIEWKLKPAGFSDEPNYDGRRGEFEKGCILFSKMQRKDLIREYRAIMHLEP